LAEIAMEIPIIFITGHGDIPTSVRAMKAGAVAFLIKPFGEQSDERGYGPDGRML
jgi:FixJ family two-component response regulator